MIVACRGRDSSLFSAVRTLYARRCRGARESRPLFTDVLIAVVMEEADASWPGVVFELERL